MSLSTTATTSPGNTAASSASTATPTRPGSPISASMPCSTGARSPAASSPATATGSASTGAWVWCPRSSTADPGAASGAPGHRPRALLHHRLHPADQRPALRGAARRPDHRHRPQRHPHQRPGDPLPPGGRRAPSSSPPWTPKSSSTSWPGTGAPRPGGVAGQRPGARQGLLFPGAGHRRQGHRRPGPPRLPAPVPGPVERLLGGGLRDLRPGPGAGRLLAGSGARRDRGHGRETASIPTSPSPRRRPNTASSSSSISPGPTAWSSGKASIWCASAWAPPWPGSTPSRPIW